MSKSLSIFHKLHLSIIFIVFAIISNMNLPNIGGSLPIVNYYFVWMAAGTIVFISLLKVIMTGYIQYNSFMKYYLIYVILLISTSLFNPTLNPTLLVYNCFWLISGLLIYLSLQQFILTEEEKYHTMVVIFFSTFIGALLAIMQFFGFSRYLPIIPPLIDGMVGGVFQQKGLLGSYVATGLVISLWMTISGRFKARNKFVKITFLFSIFLLSLALAIAMTKIGIIGLLTGAAILILKSVMRRNNYNPKKGIIIWMLLFSTGISAGYYLLSIQELLGIRPMEGNRLAWLMDTGNTSYKPRLLMYRVSLEMMMDNPVAGVGFGNFEARYQYYQAMYLKEHHSALEYLPDGFVIHPHSALLMVMAEGGAVGVIALFLLLYGFIRYFHRSNGSEAGLCYLGMLSPLVIHTLTEFPFRLSIVHYFLFVLLLSLATGHLTQNRKGVNLKKRYIFESIGVVSFLSYAAFILFMLSTFSAYMGLTRYVKTNGADGSRVKASFSNPFLKNWSVPIVMFTEINHQILSGRLDRKSAEIFLRWNSIEKMRRPIQFVFSSEAELFFVLGKKSRNRILSEVYFRRALKDIKEGMLLYPKDGYFKKLETAIRIELSRNEKQNKSSLLP